MFSWYNYTPNHISSLTYIPPSCAAPSWSSARASICFWISGTGCGGPISSSCSGTSKQVTFTHALYIFPGIHKTLQQGQEQHPRLQPNTSHHNSPLRLPPPHDRSFRENIRSNKTSVLTPYCRLHPSSVCKVPLMCCQHKGYTSL